MMKTHPQDAALRHLLRESWTVDIQATPSFRAQVWARIDALRTPQTWSAWLRIHLLGVGLASAASMAVAVSGAGFLAQSKTAQQHEQRVERYLASIDPHVKAGIILTNRTP